MNIRKAIATASVASAAVVGADDDSYKHNKHILITIGQVRLLECRIIFILLCFVRHFHLVVNIINILFASTDERTSRHYFFSNI